MDNFSVDHGLELLDQARNLDPDYPTACSMVFDPRNKEVYIGLHGDFQRIFKLSMETNTIELWKGSDQNQVRPLVIAEEGLSASDLIRHFS